MKVRDLMTSPAVVIGGDASFDEIVGVLLDNDVSGVPVVDDRGRLIGMVTEADLLSREGYGSRRRQPLGLVAEYLRGHDPQWVRKAAGQRARELMCHVVITASPDDDIGVVARTMLEEHHKRLPVVDDGHVVGVISRQDLLAAHATGRRPA